MAKQKVSCLLENMVNKMCSLHFLLSVIRTYRLKSCLEIPIHFFGIYIKFYNKYGGFALITHLISNIYLRWIVIKMDLYVKSPAMNNIKLKY